MKALFEHPMGKAIKAGVTALVLLTIGALSLSLGQKPHHLPISEHFLHRDAYSLSYDGQHRQARWVYEHLTPEKLQGIAEREQHEFQEDPSLPSLIRSSKADYAGSGFDRGHLCPAADARISDQAMKETFYLSNISPQSPLFNRGYWAKLEKHVRNLTKVYGSLHVFSGPLYLPYTEANGKKYVKYEVIGANNVGVPTHFFKMIFTESNSSWRLLEAYILPNESIDNKTPLESFLSSMEKIERLSGIIFTP